MKTELFNEKLFKGLFLCFAALLICSNRTYSIGAAASDESDENRMIIYTDKGTEQISRNIYGHFSEHLGRCIYEGFWVGEDSLIPNTRGIRNDVVEALKKTR